MHIEIWKILVAAALVVVSLVLYRRTFPPVTAARRALLVAMRIGAFVLLGLLLVNPAFISERVEVRSPLVLALLDHSRSMEIRDSGGTARLADALRRAAELRRDLAKSKVDFEVIPFAGVLENAPLRPDSSVKADGEGTDIWGALETTARKYRSRNLSAIVLLTDGRVTRGMVASGERLSVPVSAIGFGDTLAKADVSIEEIASERIAYAGTRVPVEAVILASGFKGAKLAVRLLEGGKIRDEASVSVTKDTEIISVPLTYTADAEGEHRLTIEAPPLAGEDQKDNNVEPFRLDVLKEKVRILYIDQFPDWNMTFVRDLVKRSKRLEVEAVSWVADRGFVANPGGKSWAFPASAGALGTYDLIIVSDDAKLLSARPNAEALGAFVEAGGSVLFIADENSPLGRPVSFELCAPFLPVQRAGNPRIEYAESFVRVSTEAFDDAIASMLAENGGVDAMPPLSGRIAGLAAASGARVPLVLDDRGRRTPFLALARHGEGLAAVMLGFPVWRWKLAGDEGARIYESFLGGLVQYLAEGARTGALAVDADRTVYRTGDRVRLIAYIGERRPPEGIRAEVRRKGEGRGTPVSTVVFEPDSRRKGYYRAEVEPLPSGDYVVNASEVTRSGSGMTGATSFSVADVSVEFLDVSRDAALLAHIARASGGVYLESSRTAALTSRLSFKEQRVERRDVRELRGNIIVLVGIVVFLATEWILRKAWGLV